MRKVEHRLRLDLLRGGNQGYIRVKRGENGARRLAIALYMHSVPYMADAGTTAVFRAIKPDDKKLFNSATITDNVVTVGLTTQTVAALGTVRCELSIYGTNNELLYSPQFDIIVEDYLYSDTAIESTDEYTDLTEAISKVNNIVSTEAARVAAENQRVANETARVSAEAERASAETARGAAETARATAETERASAETTRASAESARVSNENIRKQAEKQRVSSETLRDNAEAGRSTAESGRRSAETARVQEFNAIKADAQDAATAEAARALAEELRMALYNQWDNATASVKGGKNIDVNVVEADGHKNFDFTIPSDSLYCETRTTITNGDLETIAREHARTIIVFDLSPIDFNNENPTDYGLPADIAWNFTLINGPSQNVGTKDYFISYPNATVAATAFVFACPQTLIDGNNIYMRRLSYWDEKDKDEVSHWKFEGEDWEPVGGTADAVTYTPQTLTEEQKSQARTNIGALDENIHTTEVDVKRTLNGIGTNLLYVRKGWLQPCPEDANDELISSYNTAVLFLNFTSITVDSVKRHAKGAYTIYQQGLASANLQFTDNPLDVERYISWDITTNNNKTYLTYQHYGHNGFSETCRYCVEDDSYDNVRVVNALNTRQTGDNPNATANQFYLATNPTKDMHVATKQYVDTAKTEAQQLGLTTATPGQIIKVKTVQDGKPTEWEAVDMPSGGVQSDWNQNDETAADYIKNRPFYTGNPVETVLVEESTVTFDKNGGLYMAQFPSTFEATVGETYKVSWDGTVYECTCVSFNGEHAIGNLSIVSAGSDTGEPFIIGIRNGKAIQIVTADTSASHTFSISGVVSVVKIDAKYLPNTVATKSDVEAAQTTADDAQTTADNAWTKANNAQTTANNAQTTANNAQTTANAALPKAGGTMTGSLVLKGDPTAKMEAATKQYVDANKFTGEYRRRSDNKIVAIDNFSYTDNVAQFYCRATINQGTTRCDYYLGLHGKANLSILCLQDGHIQIGVSCGVANAEQNIVFTNDNKTAGYGGVNISGIEGITMFSSSSSGPGRKKFRITVDDNGVPTITDESDSTNTWKAADLYEKPTSGIPKSDLADDVQTSLAKADTSISYNSQTLTDAQKQQARTNIGAVKCSVSGNRLILTT